MLLYPECGGQPRTEFQCPMEPVKLLPSGKCKKLQSRRSCGQYLFPYWDKDEPIYSDFRTVPGDGVDGYARDHVVADESFFTKAPKLWTHLESSTLTTAALTAWRALFEDVQITKSDTILIQGTGGVSIFALQFAKMIGAKVIATSSSDDKIKRLYELGADHCINYKKTPEWGKAVLDWTNGQGVDYVVDVGGPTLSIIH
jgi:NADPH:quinone reductase-like Zn-dependent oxidoreductase